MVDGIQTDEGIWQVRKPELYKHLRSEMEESSRDTTGRKGHTFTRLVARIVLDDPAVTDPVHPVVTTPLRRATVVPDAIVKYRMRIELGKLTTFETASRDLLRVRDGDTVKVDLDEWKGYEYRVQGNVTRASGNTQVNLAVTRTCCRCEDLMHCGCVFARAGDGTGVWRKKEGCTFHFRSDLTDPVCTDCRPAEAHFSQLLLVSRPYYDEQDQAQLDYWLDQAQATCARPVQRMHELRSERKGMTAEHVSEVRRLHAQIRHLVEGVNALPRMADAMRPPARSMEETDRLARRWRDFF